MKFLRRKKTVRPTWTSLSRVHLAARLCRLGAWIIASAGLAVIVFLAITVFYPTNLSNSGLDFKQFFKTLAITLLLEIPIFFFSLILYAVGALFVFVSAENTLKKVTYELVQI